MQQSHDDCASVGRHIEFLKEGLDIWGRNMARPSPNCQALYQTVKVEAGPESLSNEVHCRVCGAPLAGRDGKFVIKYFLLREATRAQRWRRRTNKGPGQIAPLTGAE